MHRPRAFASILASLVAVASMVGCAAPEVDESEDGASAFSWSNKSSEPNTNPAAGKATIPTVIVTVDGATTQWIGAEKSKVDGAVVGDSVQRQRELYFRLQTAINSGTLEPAVVFYGLTFSQAKADARKVTDAFSKVVDASKIPVVLESHPSSDVDGTLYHSMALSDPPNMLVGQTLAFDCAVDECDNIMVPTRAGALLKSMVQVTKASAKMATSKTVLERGDAYDAVAKDLRSDVIVMRVTDKLPKISLKDLLTNPARAREVKGAFLVVSPPTEMRGKDGKVIPVKMDDLKGAVVSTLLQGY